MGKRRKRLTSACWCSENSGYVHLAQDWLKKGHPPLLLMPGKRPLASIERVSPLMYADSSGYYVDGDWVVFVVSPDYYPQIDLAKVSLYVAGSFNDWGEAVGKVQWEMALGEIEGKPHYLLNVHKNKFSLSKPQTFKFVTEEHQWLELPGGAPNVVTDDCGARNHLYNPKVTGRHIFEFRCFESAISGVKHSLLWSGVKREETLDILPGYELLNLSTDKFLGVHIEEERTLFRLFAPRASKVTVTFFESLNEENAITLEMSRCDKTTWEGCYFANLKGWYYYYNVHSETDDAYSCFDGSVKVLDPYAVASVSGKGPGIVMDRRLLPRPHHRYEPPHWHDLVIAEVHVRDLIKRAPTEMGTVERKGFSGLAKWIREEGNYLRSLGVNAVELQPVQEFGDSYDKDEYHWGYMPVNYFSPESTYARAPQFGSQIEEFQQVVKAFHEMDMAVILDVVYNHVGEPNFLLFIDKFYYFDLDQEGMLMNWSGCGNTLRSDTPMFKRLMVDSLVHWMDVFDVDGFRFDLGELIGTKVFAEIEQSLKAVKPSVILIVEPWSFRGHIVHELKETGYAFWNDGYREFVREYVLGTRDQEGIRYFMGGSQGGHAAWPAQTVNYVESHDDFSWIDLITENDGNNGYFPTINDRRRTHLLVAILMSSLGIPMLSAGQDMLRSKHGKHNTYRDGDVNALDYDRMIHFSSTHEYYRRWIQFRLSERGALFRLDSTPSEHFFLHFGAEHGSGIAMLYNADYSRGKQRLLFAVNPHFELARIPLAGIDVSAWRQLADHERFEENGLSGATLRFEEGFLYLPPLTCGLWEEC